MRPLSILGSGMRVRTTMRIYSCEDPQLTCTILLPWLQGEDSLREAIAINLQQLDPQLNVTRLDEIPALSASRPEGWSVWLDDDDRTFWLGEGEPRDLTVNLLAGPPGTAVAFALRVANEEGSAVVSDIMTAVSTDAS